MTLDEIDERLREYAPRWRAAQPPPPRVDLTRLVVGQRGLSRRGARWMPVLAVAATVAVIAGGIGLVLPRLSPPTVPTTPTPGVVPWVPLPPSGLGVPATTVQPRGLANVGYWATDWEAAKAWYTELIGFEPYFQRDGYAEWWLGDYQDELGLVDNRYRPPGAAAGPGGAIVYWHVDDVQGMFDRLLAMGATEHERPQDRGMGFVTATVVDPFGNIVGVMYNPHYVEIFAAED